MLLQPINVVYHKNASITIVLGAMVMLLLFSSCSGKKKELGDAITERDSMAVMDTRGVTTLVSDSGVTRYRINTEEWLVFDRKNPPYWAFEKGVYLEKFDSIFQVEASIKADTAYFFNKEELWKLMGNVHIQNLKGEQFDTELLYWDQRTQRIYSDEFIRIEQPDRIITGHGFESNQQMTVYTIRKPEGIFYVDEEAAAADSLQTDNHTTVSRTFHLYKHPLVALEVTTRNTDSSSFRQIQLFGLEIKQMVVIGSGNGDEALHLMVGNNYLLTTAGIGYILQISNLRLNTLYVGRTCMDKNQITDDGNQSTDFPAPTDTYLILHGNETANICLFEKMHSFKLPAVCGTHSKPNFGLFIHFYSC